MTDWLSPDAVFDGRDLHHGVAVNLRSGELLPVAAVDNARPTHGIVTPGFFDIQVNGGGGVLFNTTPTPEGLRKIAAAHAALGTVAILPTVITDAPEVLDQAAEAVLATRGDSRLLGIHIEGPHISIARRGTHEERFVRALDARTLDVVARLRRANVPVLITLAPEAVQAGEIAALVRLGAIVSLGHSDADAATVKAALAEGAQLFTHLFNAMSPMLNRAPGVTGAAIASEAYCSIICDGIHVSPEMVGIAVRARPVADRMILVSDAMPTVGGPDNFQLYGRKITLDRDRLINSEGSLAGAHVTMAQSVAFMTDVIGVDPEAALRMAVTNPARLMGCEDRFTLSSGNLVMLRGETATPLEVELA